MATFEDTVDKLGKATEKLDAASEKLTNGNGDDGGAAAKRTGKCRRKR